MKRKFDPTGCLLLMSLLAGASCGASNNSLVVLTVSGLTGDYQKLTIVPVVNRTPAMTVDETLPANHGVTQSYGLYYPADVMGTLMLTVTASGGTICLDVTGSTSVALTGADTIAASIQLMPACSPLTLSAVMPALGPTTGGTAVTLTGANFATGATVSFGGVAATNVQVMSPTQITATLPPDRGVQGRVTVAVQEPAGKSVSRSDLFSYYTTALNFGAPANFAANDPLAIAIADVNGDGKLDIAAADGPVSVLLGNGDGTFQPPRNVATGVASQFLAIGDLNGDNKPDLAVADPEVNTVGVLLGNGDGTFQGPRNLALGTGPWFVLIGDVNGDGKPDLVTANPNSNDVSVLLGHGDGTFQGAQNFTAGGNPVWLAMGDLNGDGKPDLAVGSSRDSVVILLGNGDGTFQASQDTHVGGSSVAIGDLNRDGKLDLAMPDGIGVSVLLGYGDGTFGAAQNFPAGPTLGDSSVAIVMDDINGDGKPDLAVGNTGVSVLLGNGDGTFQLSQNFAASGSPHYLAIGDLNGDAKPDIVVANPPAVDVSVLLNASQ